MSRPKHLLIQRLKNNGNSCYLNAIIQALASIPFFTWELRAALNPAVYISLEILPCIDDQETKELQYNSIKEEMQSGSRLALSDDWYFIFTLGANPAAFIKPF